MRRSSFIARLWCRLVSARRAAREARAINCHAAKLNADMKDALSFQAGFRDE
jgi:hypothetical protein